MEKILFNVTKGVYEMNGIPCYGLAQVRVKAPEKEAFPIISYKQKRTGLKVCPLCRQCCEGNAMYSCKHNNEKRCFLANLTFLEINYAKTLGYEFKFYETYLYDNEKPTRLFEDFATQFNRFCKRFENAGDKLRSKFLKQMIVSAIGRFGMKPKTNKIVLIESELEWFKLVQKKQVIDFTPVNDNFLLVTKQKLQSNRRDEPSSCLVISAYITSAARISMNRYIHAIRKANGTLYLISTDCIYFLLDKNIKVSDSLFPVPVGKDMGQFKFKLTETILSVIILGARQYAVTYEQEGKISMKAVMAGFALTKSILSAADLTYHHLKDMILAYIESNRTVSQKYVDILKNKPKVFLRFPLDRDRIVHNKSMLINIDKLTYTRKQIVNITGEDGKLNYCYIPYGLITSPKKPVEEDF